MKPPQSFLGQPIRSMQTMLQVIAEYDSKYERIIPDGIYGPETVLAISSFQRNQRLPVTGITDINTWDALVELYEEASVHLYETQSLELIFDPGQIVQKGETHPHLLLVQAMLLVLSEQYGSITSPLLSGVLDDLTEDAISSFQALSSLPTTGHLDKITWKHLALHYPLAASLTQA